MKKLIAILLFIPCLCFGQVDKILHIGYGAIVSSSTYFISNSIKDVSNTGAIIISSGMVTFVAAGKEMIDGKADIKDFGCSELGGAIGITATYFLSKNYFKRHSFYFDTRTIAGKTYNYINYILRF